MQTRVQRWGNSLALRIPKPLADEAGLRDDSPVRLTLRDRQLVIEALVQEPLNLDALLAQVTAENLHREADTGPSVGGEVW